MDNETRMGIEQQIIECVVNDAISHEYLVSVFDGEETCVSKSSDAHAIIEAMRSTDSDTLILYHCGVRIGLIQFVYGNNGYDVIADNTTNLEDFLKNATLLADELEEKYSSL